jgi:hypothetical protein
MFPRRELPRVIFELDLAHIREMVLPELLQRHLGSGGTPDFEVAILTRGFPPEVIYEPGPGQSDRIVRAADASAPMFQVQAILAVPEGPGGPRGGVRGPGRGPGDGRFSHATAEAPWRR